MSDQTLTLKTNSIKQLYFYFVIAISLIFICVGLFSTINSILVKFVFPKANNTYSYNSEGQCQMGGNQYYSMPYNMPKSTDTPVPPGEKQIQDCITATKAGVANEKESNYQAGMVFGIITLILASIVGGSHLYYRKFFLSKE